ncbi:DUF418 domain-containing protein [Pseudoclavibacter chungangensis]|uniref:DUF418 domain-containing protein n=1 Tax=Pseudoclavibacter chungangensis TaxID=587635 RepID=A0A7J5BMT1_9MICO|nr:DUF418 domain-containing protein [Pseudoclavibacter chungangensis]KAB1652980.1 DUF418 domain-containing protein [Pseudoclavibacter chungangensis]NYJ65220.1 putative membrane protein YeiB [Pseudoclavibacter chungangensis]
MPTETPTSDSHRTASARERAIAPDLARGLMLLLIALANVSWFLYDRPVAMTSAHELGADGLDLVWQSIAIIAIDGRSYPLFAFLFGYGIWQLYSRQLAQGRDERDARRLLQRRHLWLVAFGFVNAALLWYGDILGAYGLVGLVVVWLFLRRRTTTLLVWCAAVTAAIAAFAMLSHVGGILTPADAVGTIEPSTNPSAVASYPESLVDRLLLWLPLTFLQGIFGGVVPVALLLGIVAARSRILEEPVAHRALLARTALIGIPIGWIGGLPALLLQAGVWDVMPWTAAGTSMLTGLFGGIGYAALFGLVAARFTSDRRPGPVAGALVAVGKRSLSMYLLQSVLFAIPLCAWGFGLGAVLPQWQAALYAVGVWLVGLVIAALLERAGARGPAERLLRRLAYRPDDRTATPVS